MKKQIILTVDKDGALAPFLQTCAFALYQKDQARWHRVEATQINGPLLNAADIREMVGTISKHFQDCRILISRKVLGVAYQTLNMAGFSIFEAEDISAKLLDGTLSDVMKNQAKPDQPPLEPQSPNRDGRFVFDLVRLQKAYPQVSSKKALMAFMTVADFLSLELICDHLPPWLEDLMKARDYRYSAKSEGLGALRYFIEKT